MANETSQTAVQNGQAFEECGFEISPVICRLTGGIRAAVYEEGGQAPTTIVSTAQSWYVDVQWYINGPLIRHLCGEWCLNLHLESLGPAKEYTYPKPPVKIPFDPCGDGKYSYRIEVPEGTIDPADCGTLYLLAVTLTSKDPCGKPGHIAAYCKGPCLMFYDPHDHGTE